jgi:hypothetical protein
LSLLCICASLWEHKLISPEISQHTPSPQVFLSFQCMPQHAWYSVQYNVSEDFTNYH